MARKNSLGDTAIGKLYLLAYNLIQGIGWSYGFIKFILHVSATGTYVGAWDEAATVPISIFQTLQAIEVIHCIVGLVPSNAVQTAMQIASRLMVLWCCLRPIPECRNQFGTPLVLFAWCIAESTRYYYYALNLYDAVPSLLVWCRYSFFIVLYPIGVVGEMATVWAALPFIKSQGLYTMPLPNIFNISFHMDIAVIISCLLYIPFFPKLYGYMLSQRKKFLGGGGPAKTKAH